jgi:hypothetical protein
MISAFFKRNRIHKYINALLALSIILFIAYQIDNIPRTDDDYLGEQVYWLLKDGVVKSQFGYENLGYDIYQSIYHKLFIYNGYLMSYWLGWSLYSLHLVSYIWWFIFLAVLWKGLAKVYPEFKGEFWKLFLLLLLLNPDLIYGVGTFRPEVMLMTLGFISYLCIHIFLSSNRSIYLIISSAAAGLAMFAHLNGVIYIVAGFVLLTVNKRYAKALWYLFIAGMVAALFFIDVLQYKDLNFFWSQFKNDPVLNGADNKWYHIFIKLAAEQSRFFYTPKQIIISGTLILSLIFSWKKLYPKHKNLLLYTLTLVIVGGMFNPSKTPKYLILYMPFLYLLLIFSWNGVELLQQRVKQYCIRVCMLGVILLGVYHAVEHILINIANLKSGGIIQEHAAIEKMISEPANQVVVLGSRPMIFNSIPHYKAIKDIALVGTAEMNDIITHAKVDYIVLDKQECDRFNLDSLLTNNSYVIKKMGQTAHYTVARVYPK